MDLDWRGTPESMAAMWVDEKSCSNPAPSRRYTRSGRWEDVAHYTQMIWPTTTHVGCALHDGRAAGAISSAATRRRQCGRQEPALSPLQR
jgi:hypothetical protein